MEYEEAPLAPQPSPEPEPTGPMITRAEDQPDMPEPIERFIKRWSATIKSAEKFHDKAMKRIKRNRELVRHGADKAWRQSGKYSANITLRHVTRKAADLYARNPRAVAKRRVRLEYQLWDGDPQTVMMAQQAMAAGMMDPNSMALLQEIQEVKQRQHVLDKVAKTQEILFHHSLDSQDPSFKVGAKGAVRKAIVDSVAFVKLDFYREFESANTVLLHDKAAHPAQLPGAAASATDHAEHDDDLAAKVDSTMAQMAYAQNETNVLEREGLIYTFPAADEIVIDPKCRCLRSFEGADWIAFKALRSVEQIREVYGIDVGNKFTGYYSSEDNPGAARLEAAGDDDGKTGKGSVMVYEIQDKRTGNVFTLAEGYDGFLEEPSVPMITLDRFYTIIPLLFNQIETGDSLYPPSDVELMEDMQHEYNRARHGVREHRKASRPRYVAPAGKLEEDEKAKIASCPPHSLLELNGITPGEDIRNIIQAFPTMGIDQGLYETGSILDDTLRTTGSQEANLGGVAGATATETQIAEGSRVASVQSNVDDLDDWLSELAESAGAALLQNMSPQTVQKIVGPGSSWPEFTAADINAEIYLEVKAGSAGRPNKAAELANLERAAPILLQTPGISPIWFAREVIKRLDDGLDLDEAIAAGVPSITAQNALLGRGGPDPYGAGAEGGAQSEGGSQNTPNPQTNEPGPQGGFPA